VVGIPRTNPRRRFADEKIDCDHFCGCAVCRFDPDSVSPAKSSDHAEWPDDAKWHDEERQDERG